MPFLTENANPAVLLQVFYTMNTLQVIKTKLAYNQSASPPLPLPSQDLRSSYKNESEVQLILWWISDDQILRMVIWSTSLRSIFGTYAKFGLDDFLAVSQWVRTTQRDHDCIPTSLLSISANLWWKIWMTRFTVVLSHTWRIIYVLLLSLEDFISLLVLVPFSSFISLFSYGGIHIGQSLF